MKLNWQCSTVSEQKGHNTNMSLFLRVYINSSRVYWYLKMLDKEVLSGRFVIAGKTRSSLKPFLDICGVSLADYDN